MERPASDIDSAPAPSPIGTPVGRALTVREREVLSEVARGLSSDEIAKLLFLSSHTVRAHIRNSMRKLGAATRAHAVAMAITDGSIDPLPERRAFPG